jgi:hypothetical protein
MKPAMARRSAALQRGRLALVLLALSPACAHEAAHGAAESKAQAAQKAAKPLLPPGCEANFSGEYVHQDNASYHYTAKDDGNLLTLHPYRLADDGTVTEISPKSQDMLIELRRQPEGFVGVFRMTEEIDGGVRCQALFSAKVTACSPTRLTLQIEQTYAMDQACRRVDTGGADIAEHVLVKRQP